MDLILTPISIAKKPIILFSDAINYVTFLCYYGAISSLTDDAAVECRRGEGRRAMGRERRRGTRTKGNAVEIVPLARDAAMETMG